MTIKKPERLKHEDFVQAVKNSPLVSIDLIVTDNNSQVLLGLRKNAPAKDFWFVPGGTILKNERIEEAFKRISHAELGICLPYDKAEFVGVFEHIYPDNFTQQQKFSTHYIVLAYRIPLNHAELNLPTDQHSKYKWSDTESLLNEENVHPLTKAYFNCNPAS